jgi:methionyl-tRNA formyltransferase
MKPKIIFMGTPKFAVPTLKAINEEFGITAVVTAADKPSGRGQKPKQSEVKTAALELGLQVLQPDSLKSDEFVRQISEIEPDIIIVVAFRILPASVYTLAKLGAFNIHASLLPKFRGAAPINWAIINGERQSGLTTFLLNEKVDTGSVLIQMPVDISEDATAGDLHDILMELSPKAAIETCNMLLSGNFIPIKQNDSEATPAPKIFPEMCAIDWSKTATDVKNFIHGMSPYPGAWTTLESKRLKILKCRTSSADLPQGNCLFENGKMLIGCRNGSIELIEVQYEGRKSMTAADFINGWRGSNHLKLA